LVLSHPNVLGYVAMDNKEYSTAVGVQVIQLPPQMSTVAGLKEVAKALAFYVTVTSLVVAHTLQEL
jgi:hypothetical protein